MYDCHGDILAYHNKEVTLAESERTEMRERRDTNRERLRLGLESNGQVSPAEFHSQGSYSHRTMVQHRDKDYDIDDGVYFWQDDLQAPDGSHASAADMKRMVRDALQDDRFNKPPRVRTNCVRIYYEEGYHVDVPVYRHVSTVDDVGEPVITHEIASTDWKASDPAAVTQWFAENNKRKSPDATNGRQLRRITRLLKAFAKSRQAWRSQIAPGFTITTLIVDECYQPDSVRDDRALLETMAAMRDRLNLSLEVSHPVVEDQMLTSGPYDSRSKELLDRLEWAVEKLEILFSSDCTHEQAAKAWGDVFNTQFFRERVEKSGRGQGGSTTSSRVSSTHLQKLSDDSEIHSAVDKRGGGRYA